MNYRQVYMRIISHAKSEQSKGLRPSSKYTRYKFPNQYFEFHHILPKSLFPNWEKGNKHVVPLTPREHFFAHQLLTKIYRASYEMKTALYFMACTRKDTILTSREYERIRTDFCKAVSNRKKGIQVAITLGKHWFTNGKENILSFERPIGFVPGRVHDKIFDTVEDFLNFKKSKEKFRKTNERKGIIGGWKHSEETKRKISEGHKGSKNGMFGKPNQKGKKWFNNGIKNILVFESEKPEGFVEGKIAKRPVFSENYGSNWMCIETGEYHKIRDWKALGYSFNYSRKGEYISKSFHFKKME